MAGITLAQAQSMLDLYIQVEMDILNNGQSTAILGREFRAADLETVRKARAEWDTTVKQLSGNSAGGIRVRGLTAG